MQPPVPDLTNFPLWAQILIYSILAVSIGVATAFSWLGYIKGKTSTASPPSTNQAQVAAVIVDPTALVAATNAVIDLTKNVSNLTEAIERMTVEMIRNGARR